MYHDSKLAMAPTHGPAPRRPLLREDRGVGRQRRRGQHRRYRSGLQELQRHGADLGDDLTGAARVGDIHFKGLINGELIVMVIMNITIITSNGR